MKELERRKQQLLARSQVSRQNLANALTELKTATAWIPHTVQVVRAASPVLLMALPLIGYLFARKGRIPQAEPKRRPGMLASALAGYKFYRQMKPVWDGLRSRRNH